MFLSKLLTATMYIASKKNIIAMTEEQIGE